MIQPSGRSREDSLSVGEGRGGGRDGGTRKDVDRNIVSSRYDFFFFTFQPRSCYYSVYVFLYKACDAFALSYYYRIVARCAVFIYGNDYVLRD